MEVAQGCSEPVLQSSTEHQGSYFAVTKPAMHLCCITAHLYEEQISIGVIALAQGCCEASLQSSTEQHESCFPLTSAAVHGCCIITHLYEGQIYLPLPLQLSACFAEQH